MKIRIDTTLNIDIEAWMDVYGVERSEVRKDVNEWASNLLFQAAQDNGVVTDPA